MNIFLTKNLYLSLFYTKSRFLRKLSVNKLTVILKLDMRNKTTIRLIVNNIFYKRMSQSAVSW